MRIALVRTHCRYYEGLPMQQCIVRAGNIMSPFCSIVWTCQPFLVVYKKGCTVYLPFMLIKGDTKKINAVKGDAFGMPLDVIRKLIPTKLTNLCCSDDWYFHVTHCFGWRFNLSHFGFPDWARRWVVSWKMRCFLHFFCSICILIFPGIVRLA